MKTKSLQTNGLVANDGAKFIAMLKEERKKKKWSYDELGKKLGVSASYMFRLEKGERTNPSSDVLKKVCELFGVDPRTVLDMDMDVIDGLAINGKIIDADVMQETFKRLLDTDVEKMSEVSSLLQHIGELQKQYKK